MKLKNTVVKRQIQQEVGSQIPWIKYKSGVSADSRNKQAKGKMNSMMKKSLGAPIRHMTSCVTGVQDGFSRKSKTVRRKSAPCCYGQPGHDSSWIRAYQTELHRERKLRQVKFAQKNAERGAMRAHYKSPHRFSKTPVQRTQFNSKMASKNDDSLFGAFQGLSLSMGGAQTSMPTGTSADQCKVM